MNLEIFYVSMPGKQPFKIEVFQDSFQDNTFMAIIAHFYKSIHSE